MTIRHLQVFITVVDNGCSVTRAAEQLNIAQPSVSQTVSELEKYYGVQLFERLNRRLYLSPAGKRLSGHARRMLDSFFTLDTEMKASSGHVALRVGASLTVGTMVLPGILKALPYPVEVSVFNTHIIEDDILESRLDIAIVEGDVNSRELVQIEICTDTLVMVAAAETSSRLADHSVCILREEGSGTRELALSRFKVPDHTRIWNVSNTQTLIALVKAGLGYTVISRQLIEKELKTGKCIQMECDKRQLFSADRSFHIIYHKDKHIDDRIDTFIQIAKKSASRPRGRKRAGRPAAFPT